MLAAVSLGLAVGLGGYGLSYARGLSYLSDDPAACANCHVMREWYDAWSRSSHHAVATCNDCHTPASLVGKYTVKALNGYHHSRAFTTGDFPDRIVITPANHAVAQETCVKCHESMVQDLAALSCPDALAGDLPCSKCHGSVGHPF
jgi:cytochrome c nitrite reductase small subunit